MQQQHAEQGRWWRGQFLGSLAEELDRERGCWWVGGHGFQRQWCVPRSFLLFPRPSTPPEATSLVQVQGDPSVAKQPMERSVKTCLLTSSKPAVGSHPTPQHAAFALWQAACITSTERRQDWGTRHPDLPHTCWLPPRQASPSLHLCLWVVSPPGKTLQSSLWTFIFSPIQCSAMRPMEETGALETSLE